MDFRDAMKGQYHASLTMLREAIEKCPDEVWEGGGHPRTFRRIVYHALFYTDLYLRKDYASFKPWHGHTEDAAELWDEPAPGGYSKAEMLEYWAVVNGAVDAEVDACDFTRAECGFDWYKLPKLDHMWMNIRHLEHHVGQLCERLLSQDIEVGWAGRRS